MTLTSATNRVQYSGDSSTISFSVSFVFWDLDDPQAVLTDSSGVETTWVRGTQYTMSGGSGSTGTLTVITSPTDYTPATGETLTIKSNLANTQPTSLPSGGSFPSGTVEQQLDQIVRQVQQLAEEVDRSIKLKVSSAETDVTIEDLTGNTAKFAQVNTAEDGFQYVTVTSSGTITDPVPVANGGTAATTAAAALTNLGARGQGLETIWIPARGMLPTVSNGCAALARVETTAGRPDLQVLDFDNGADEHAQFDVTFPKSWNKGTVTYRGHWTVSAAVTTGVAIGLQAVSMADSDTNDVAYGTPIVVTDDALNASEDEHITSTSAAVTIAGTPGNGERTVFRVFRDISDGNDDMTQDMRLLGITLFYTANAADDT